MRHSTPSLFSLLLRCTDQRIVKAGRSVHALSIKIGSLEDRFVGNSVVNMYAKCGHLSNAAMAFEDMGAGCWDVVSWNCLINSYSQLGLTGSAAVFDLFRRMVAHGGSRPNAFTFAGVFSAASHSLEMAGWGMEAHCVAIKTDNSADVFVGSSLLNMYCKLGLLSDARKVFDRMPQKNSVSWAAMISGYASNRDGFEAFELFRLMVVEDECSVNEFVVTSVLSALVSLEFLHMGRQVHDLTIKNGLVSFIPVDNSLITLYTKCHCLDEALVIFMSSDNKSPITWSAMITGYAQNGDSLKALQLFCNMHSNDVSPTEFTFVGILNACGDQSLLPEGIEAHCYILKLGFETQVYVKSALVDMYAKCFRIEDARRAFDMLREVDVVLWTTMISAYVQNGEHEEALTMYNKMESDGLLPNNLTIASALRACSSLAAFEHGKQIHARTIKHGFGIGIPIGSALSTMYAKCGNLEECGHVFRRMPQKDVVAWNSIISGYSQNGRGVDALNLFEEMRLEGTEPDHVTFINVLFACSHIGLVEKGWSYFRLMQDEYGLAPKIEHFACMVDMLTRAGKFEEAREFIESVPMDHGMCLWRIVLGSCRNKKNFHFGAYAGERLMELGSTDSSAYILLSNIYASWNRRDDVERVRRLMKLRGVNKEPGCSWIEMKSRVHVFVIGELLHPEIEDIYVELRWLTKHMKEEGYFPDTGVAPYDHLMGDLGYFSEEELPMSASLC
ncbi:pentatricopeptide repeat-containing protein At2g33680 [Phalaenopsis equestris]|uniref:pentatricopeptide repeat-containing protein At2g33680 n=1 Tax=Phalaenopsis equestris TaxID=78828 RepID=UPI0009E40D56|nr:pentatricopeptide repeat-containing protein At2g33680 [Phalaenopsis equestris]